ncbi:hypothetical protein BJV82DRAFT_309474 [Fennellomyces sp. T-0311]|nr:hypothetical protein BJV82DRAFT_309474 [Fennellomyces sp. T-0311]
MTSAAQHDDVEDSKTLLIPENTPDASMKATEDYATADADRWAYAGNPVTAEYAQLDVDDSETTPLGNFTDTSRLNVDNSDDDDDDPKFFDYRLPTEGGSIFASFVSLAKSMAFMIYQLTVKGSA